MNWTGQTAQLHRFYFVRKLWSFSGCKLLKEFFQSASHTEVFWGNNARSSDSKLLNWSRWPDVLLGSPYLLPVTITVDEFISSLSFPMQEGTGDGRNLYWWTRDWSRKAGSAQRRGRSIGHRGHAGPQGLSGPQKPHESWKGVINNANQHRTQKKIVCTRLWPLEVRRMRFVLDFKNDNDLDYRVFSKSAHEKYKFCEKCIWLK